MAIIGLTEDKDGNPLTRRVCTTKLSIGYPPDKTHNYPRKTDRILFLRQVMEGKDIAWEEDEELTAHYSPKSKEHPDGIPCREVEIVLLDNDIEALFPTMWRAYKKSGCWCRGDGVHAERRPNVEKAWNPFEIFKGPCANDGCPLPGDNECKPNGVMYFMLRDFPAIGTACKINTTGKASIASLSSSMREFEKLAGRLQGISVKVFIKPEKTAFNDSKSGERKTSMIWVWGLKIDAATLKEMQAKMLEAAQVFSSIRGYLTAPAQVIDAEEADDLAAGEMIQEFYPEVAEQQRKEEKPKPKPATETSSTEVDVIKEKCLAAMKRLQFNQAQQLAFFSKNSNALPEALLQLECEIECRTMLQKDYTVDQIAKGLIEATIKKYEGQKIFKLRDEIKNKRAEKAAAAQKESSPATDEKQEEPTSTKPVENQDVEPPEDSKPAQAESKWSI